MPSEPPFRRHFTHQNRKPHPNHHHKTQRQTGYKTQHRRQNAV
ncbi:hypothetical protein AB9R03_02660 [Neisseria gonorrhoeae]